MDILNNVTRWIGSKRSEVYHCLDQWKQAFYPGQEKLKLGQSVTSKALSMTGLGFGLSPTSSHPDGGGLGFLKHLPLAMNGSGVSSDGMISHSFPHVSVDESKYPSQPPRYSSGMAGQSQNPQNISVDTQHPRLQGQYQQPCPIQQCHPTFMKNLYQPAHLVGGGMGPAIQGVGFQERPINAYIGQSFTQAQTPQSTMWTGLKGANMPQPHLSFYGDGQQHNTSQWSEMYPHCMQLPRAQCYHPGAMMHQARPHCVTNSTPGAPQYFSPSNYQPVYEDPSHMAQQQYLPVGTPYVMCQSGSSPYLSIIPLQSVQVLLPAHILAASPESNHQSLRQCATNPAPPVQTQDKPTRLTVAASAPAPPPQPPFSGVVEGKAEKTPTAAPKKGHLPTDSLALSQDDSIESPDSEEKNELDEASPDCSLLITTPSIEHMEMATLPNDSSCDTFAEGQSGACRKAGTFPQSEPAADDRAPTPTREERWPEKLDNRTPTPAPRKKKKVPTATLR